MKTRNHPLLWNRLFLVTFAAAYVYVFNEWLFSVTKPSFLNSMGLFRQLQILFFTGALLAALCFACFLPLVILSLLPPLKRSANTLIRVCALLPAVIFATLILLMIDDFTYTVFHFGIVSTEGVIRGVYALNFVLLILVCYKWVLNAIGSLSQRTRIVHLKPGWLLGLAAIVVLLSILILVSHARAKGLAIALGSAAMDEKRPHVILITGDGISASSTSVYGYDRDTTPYLKELAKTSLVAENAYANATSTTGSIVSLYTGKYPAQTRLLFSPDILKGKDAYEHLPGILRANGYKTVSITLPHYLDAGELNILEAFDEMKSYGAVHSSYLRAFNRVLPDEEALFVDEIFKRVLDRITHIFFIKKMSNAYLIVTRMSEPLADMEKYVYMMQEIRNAKQPVFIHVHLMKTHGVRFHPEVQKFSAGQPINTQKPWSIDFFDDSLLEEDKDIGKFIDFLQDQGVFDNTIFIVGSDHAFHYDPLKRVPLLIHFPADQYAGRISTNAQNLDIAPTILDYLGIETPGWMPGHSLIAGDLQQRPIFTAAPVMTEQESTGRALVMENVKPPFYQFGSIYMIYNQKWFTLHLNPISWEEGMIEDYSPNSQPAKEITSEEAFRLIVDHLHAYGFDVSRLDHIPAK